MDVDVDASAAAANQLRWNWQNINRRFSNLQLVSNIPCHEMWSKGYFQVCCWLWSISPGMRKLSRRSGWWHGFWGLGAANIFSGSLMKFHLNHPRWLYRQLEHLDWWIPPKFGDCLDGGLFRHFWRNKSLVVLGYCGGWNTIQFCGDY